ncbi:MAG TPA: M90 family metallopeptidase [Gemmatimonadales bacterium]|nr:M90 family metallopeptidase [Gemmatimonadales bacterium]
MSFFRSRRRATLRATPFPNAWRDIIQRNVPLFERLPLVDQTELLGHVQVFLAEKHFEGCGGLQITDEVRVTIAAQACVLLLHRDADYYPRLTSILVYPATYVLSDERALGGGLWEEVEHAVDGHTQQGLGAVVLTWDAVARGASALRDGHNLVLHEFAHQLDFEDGSTDGAPWLDSRRQYRTWARVLSSEFEAFRTATDAGEPTLLDAYGATDLVEFFAVATEFFFERPHEMRAKHPALYEQLQHFYRQDPASF